MPALTLSFWFRKSWCKYYSNRKIKEEKKNGLLFIVSQNIFLLLGNVHVKNKMFLEISV
jgi:DNA phosphorothioation-dependent restriction protein DptG